VVWCGVVWCGVGDQILSVSASRVLPFTSLFLTLSLSF